MNSVEYRLHQWVSQQNLQHSTDVLVEKAQNWLFPLDDQDIIELLMTGFIPDTYEENREEEKIFTKLMEVLVAECFRRIGFDSTVVKTKSESEDVRIATERQAILVDTKTFRLGRSQIAPNAKDFIKLHTVEGWIKHYNRTNKRKAIGGLVVYPSTHEWVKQSQVYKECSNQQTPVVMLSYEILAFLLQMKQSFHPNDLFPLWNYKNHFSQPVSTRNEYWNVMIPLLSKILKISTEEFLGELEIFQMYYSEAIKEAKTNLSTRIESISEQIPKRIEQMKDEDVRSLLEKILVQSETLPLTNSIVNIVKNRKSFLFIEDNHCLEDGVA